MEEKKAYRAGHGVCGVFVFSWSALSYSLWQGQAG